MYRYSRTNYQDFIINESSLNRVWEHSKKGFVVISAYLNVTQYLNFDINDSKGKLSYEELQIMNSNVDDLKQREKDIYKDITKYFQKELDDYNLDADNSLRQDFSSSEYSLGFIQQIGRYTDKITNVTSDEPSYLVPFYSQLYTWDEFLNKMIKLMFEYYQQCILLCQPNNNGTYDVGFYYSNGSYERLQNSIQILPKNLSGTFLSILKYGPHSDRAYKFKELNSHNCNLNEKYDLIGFKSNCMQHIQERLYYKNTKQIFV